MKICTEFESLTVLVKNLILAKTLEVSSMARVLILTTHNKLDNVNNTINCCLCNKNCAENTLNSDIDAILDRSFYTTCPDCIARFMKDISNLGLFKCLWEPKVFVRGRAKFVHETTKYYLTLTISIVDKQLRLSRSQFSTQFSGVVNLSITNKFDASKSKSVNLFDLHCDTSSTTMKTEYIKNMRDFIVTTFGIDFKKWNEILNDKISGTVTETQYDY